MAKSRVEINRDSDDKRGVKVKGFKLKLEDIAFIENISKQYQVPQSEFITKAIHHYAHYLATQPVDSEAIRADYEASFGHLDKAD